jgi:hypothetical protein
VGIGTSGVSVGAGGEIVGGKVAVCDGTGVADGMLVRVCVQVAVGGGVLDGVHV